MGTGDRPFSARPPDRGVGSAAFQADGVEHRIRTQRLSLEEAVKIAAYVASQLTGEDIGMGDRGVSGIRWTEIKKKVGQLRLRDIE